MSQPQPVTQSKEKRARNFGEVSLGYPKRLAGEESRRCPQCSDPVCRPGCPLGIDIPAFVRLLREGDVNAALNKILEENPLPSICGRICPAPCEKSCVFEKDGAPIGIRALERYAADHGKPKSSGKFKLASAAGKIAVIGSGPAGLTAAFELARRNYQVKIFESLPQPGGVLSCGIPEFRLPAKVLQGEIDRLKSLGVEIETNCRLGQMITVDDLFRQGFAAVLLALGAARPEFFEIPGNSLGGVFYAEEVLMHSNLLKSGLFSKPMLPANMGSRIAVIGGGNIALDCARVCARWGKNVSLVFETIEEEMTVYSRERELAREEGVKLQALTRVNEIIPDPKNFVSGLKCQHMDFADPNSADHFSLKDANSNEVKMVSTGKGKWELMAVPDSGFTLDADTVVIALGKKPSAVMNRMAGDLKLNADGTIWVNADNGQTSRPKVFAAGDIVLGAGFIVDAMASGKKAARQIHESFKGK